MFKKITLENFKGFATNQSIEIKPITLIYGANSSGKSSILQSLLLMKQTNKVMIQMQFFYLKENI